MLMVDQLGSVINSEITDKVKKYVNNYLRETDAVLFSELLEQTNEMLMHIKEIKPNRDSVEYDLIMDEFKLRWKDMNNIVLEARNSRPAPAISDSDMKMMNKIISLSRELMGKDLPGDGLIHLLLEVKNHE